MSGLPPSDTPEPARKAGLARPLLPVTLVALALITLAIVAVSIDRQMVVLAREITNVADPFRAAVRETQTSLALETAGTRGYLLTGDSGFAAGHREARARRQAAAARLLVIARRTDPEIRALADTLSALLVPADATLDSLYSGRITRQDFVARLPAQQRRLEGVMATLTQIGVAVNRATAARFARLQRALRRTVILSLILVVITVGASIQVTRLGLSYRRLAVEAQHARAEAERRRIESERIAESRARLVRGFTHDVKNPLGAADGYLDLLESGYIEPDEGVRGARRTVRAALSLIEDLLTLARAESGEIAIRRAPFDLAEVTRQALADARPHAISKGIALNLELPDALPRLRSDRERVRQVLDNFISNAIKYTDGEVVTVRVRTWSELNGDIDRTWAQIDVCDTGPGLTPEQSALAFQEFRRLDTATGTEGTGLGLAISRRVAEALGGEVLLESSVGVGSTFSLRLPVEWETPDPVPTYGGDASEVAESRAVT